MAFLEDIGKKISDAGQSTIQKTRDLADTAKYTTAIFEEEKKIEFNMEQIGKLYYEEIKSAPGDNYAQYVEQINESQRKIEEMQEKIKEMKARGRCSNCGAPVSNEDVFCAACGYKIERQKPGIVCAACGKKLDPGMAFCIYCGTKVEKTDSETEEAAVDITEEVVEDK